MRRLVAAALLSMALASCVGVRPWQRGKLSKQKMQVDGQSEAVLIEQHTFSYREGSSGGYGGSGGGCGCN